MKHSAENTLDIVEEYSNFFLKFRSLELSTISENGRPQISYTPFVEDDEKNFFIFVSSLANHTKNLITHQKAGVMFIESEEKSENIFARKRLIFDCDVYSILKNSYDWNYIMKKFDKEFGDIMETLRMLSDFQLFKLMPNSGRFIKGFGNAYEISGKKMNEIKHLIPKKK